MLRKLLICTYLLSFGALAGANFTYDGHYDSNEYDVTFDINYYAEDGTTLISGGTLALANHGGNQYIYIAHPLGFKDLSYGDDASKVGWGNKNHASVDKAIGSEFFTLTLNDGSDLYTMEFNPGAAGYDHHPEKGHNHGTNEINDNVLSLPTDLLNVNGLSVGFLSTMNYNATLINSDPTGFYSGVGAYVDNSPQRAACAGDETNSDPSCYIAANGEALSDWDFHLGIEIKLAGVGLNGFFDLANIDSSAFGYKDHSALISLDALHASPPKVECNSGSDKEPCNADVVERPPGTPVPEPSSLAIFGLGLLGLYTRRRSAIKTV